MTHNTDVLTLARWMAGDFTNQEQAFENPPFFAHIRVCMRPTSLNLNSGISLYLEQAYDYCLHQPYRVRVLTLIPQTQAILIKNYTLKNSADFVGAARKPERLKNLSASDLEAMEGCNMIVQWNNHRFVGTVEPGKACLVVRNGHTTYLDSQFEIDEHTLVSYDRGRDRLTHQLAWGSVAGPFRFQRTHNFEQELPHSLSVR
jgi:hypothetical protein